MAGATPLRKATILIYRSTRLADPAATKKTFMAARELEGLEKGDGTKGCRSSSTYIPSVFFLLFVPSRALLPSPSPLLYVRVREFRGGAEVRSPQRSAYDARPLLPASAKGCLECDANFIRIGYTGPVRSASSTLDPR